MLYFLNPYFVVWLIFSFLFAFCFYSQHQAIDLKFSRCSRIKKCRIRERGKQSGKDNICIHKCFLDKFVIKRTKNSAAKSTHKKLDEKIIWTFQFVFPFRRNKNLRCKWRNLQRKQSARKRFYRWTDEYFLKFKWLIKIRDEKLCCKFVFSLELYIKLETWSFRGAGLGMMKASTKNISRDTSFKEEYSKNKISRDKLVILQQFLQRRPTENLQQTECECIRAAKLVSLVTCDILTRYQ